MPKINDNFLVKGARGNMSKQFVYKTRGNNTHIAKMPVRNRKIESTERQLEIRDLFTEASAYATGAIDSPELKKEYEKKAPAGVTAFNMALRDFLKPPVVKSIDASMYDGSVSSTIAVKARDDFRVASVTVSIKTAAGALVEEGAALLNPINRNQWIYSAVKSNASLAGSIISATARDVPGNKAKLEITL
jgi:hypothetical protein